MAYSKDWGMSRVHSYLEDKGNILDNHTYLKGAGYTVEEMHEAIINATRIIGEEDTMYKQDLSWISTFELVEELNKRRETEVQQHIDTIQKSIEALKRLGINICDCDYDPAHIAFEQEVDCNRIVMSINID